MLFGNCRKQERKGILLTHNLDTSKLIPAHSDSAMKPNDGHIDLCYFDWIKTNVVAYSLQCSMEKKKSSSYLSGCLFCFVKQKQLEH